MYSFYSLSSHTPLSSHSTSQRFQLSFPFSRLAPSSSYTHMSIDLFFPLPFFLTVCLYLLPLTIIWRKESHLKDLNKTKNSQHGNEERLHVLTCSFHKLTSHMYEFELLSSKFLKLLTMEFEAKLHQLNNLTNGVLISIIPYLISNKN